MDPFDYLQDWYLRHCDGEWEHAEGITITTLDNPGWSVKISLVDTGLEGRSFAAVTRGIESNQDWLVAKVADRRFEGYGGAKNLRDILQTFQDWASG